MSKRTSESVVRRHTGARYWIASVVGLAVLLSGCFGGQSADAFLATAAPTPEPMYEPAGEVGNNPFFSVDEQVAATNSGQLTLALAEAEAAGLEPMSAIAQISLTSPSEDEIKSGLYGGSLENTCDPERLIKHLLDNPTQGQVWADVQGIAFTEIPTFIRSLEPSVLEADRTVLNHGYDPKGHAIPIVSTLAAGTAVLLDDNGDVRTRCYCGNPILPYDEQDYEPPQCLTFFAIVYVSPADRKTAVENVPRSVKATNQISSHEGVEWKEIAWGDTTGWVRADESETRYCKPHDKIECVDAAQITQRPGSDDFVGQLENSYVSVVAPNLDGWSLIKFAETSGWIEASAVGGTTCDYQVDCVASSTGTWTRPGFAGREIVRSTQAQRVEYTGQTFFDGTGTYRQVYVTHPGPSRIGYVRQADVRSLDSSECQVGVYCTLFDIDVSVYQEAEGTATWGVMWFGEVDLVSNQPTNGRYQIDWGTATGWVDIGDLHGFVTGHPCATSSCIQIYGQSIYEPLPDNAGTRATPTGPIVAHFTGKVHYVSGDTYREFTSPAISGGPGWLEASVGYYPRDWSACEVEPPCIPEYQVCRVECVAEYTDEGWTVRALWDPATRLIAINFDWPPGLTGQPMIGLKSSGVSDFASGSPILNAPVTVRWNDPVTGFSGQAECEVNLCDYLDVDGDLGYLGDRELPDPESCVVVTCTTALRAGNGGFARDVTISWTDPAIELSYINWDFPPGYAVSSGSRNDRLSPQTFSQAPGPDGIVDVTWIGPDGQSGTVSCEIGDECDVFDIEFTTSETANCCPDGTQFVDPPGECCPAEQLSESGECCLAGTARFGGECTTCPYEKLPSGECCPADQVLNSEFCCPDGTRAGDTECVRECDGVLDANGECCSTVLTEGFCTPICPEGSNVEITDDGAVCSDEEEAEPDPVTPDPVTPDPVTPTPVTPTPVTPTPETPTVTPVPETPTPTPVTCPNGANDNGDCFRVCAPSELNLDGLCICSDGFQLDGVNGCIIDCPATQVPINSSECGCPSGTFLEGSSCVAVEVVATCNAPYVAEGPNFCYYSGFPSEPICPATGGPVPTLRVVEEAINPATDMFDLRVVCDYTL